MSDEVAARIVAVQRRVAFLVAASLIPALLVAIVIVGFDYYQRERERQLRDSLGTARAMAAAVDAELNGVKAALFALGTSPFLAAENLPAFHRQASAALEVQGFANIGLFDSSVRPLVNTLVPFGAPLPAQTGAPQLARALEAEAPTVTDLFLGRASKQPLIAVGIPLRLDTGKRYVLAAGITPERLSRLLAEQHLPADWVGAIFDSSGTIVARTREASRFVGQKASPPLLERMVQAREGIFEGRTLEGIPVATVFSHSPGAGWIVAIGIPLAYFGSELVYALARVFMVGFVMLTVALAIALLIARRIVR